MTLSDRMSAVVSEAAVMYYRCKRTHTIVSGQLSVDANYAQRRRPLQRQILPESGHCRRRRQ